MSTAEHEPYVFADAVEAVLAEAHLPSPGQLSTLRTALAPAATAARDEAQAAGKPAA